MRVRELRDVSDLSALQNEWNTLLSSTDNALFSSWEWITCWWKHFGGTRQMRVLVAEDDSQIVAIAPLMLTEYKLMKFSKLRKMEFIGSPQSDYNNFILTKNPSNCMRLFMKHIESINGWHYLELRDVLEDSVSARLLCDHSVTPAWKLEKRVLTLAPYIVLPPTFESLLTQLRRKLRREIARLERRLKEEYQVELRTYREFSSVNEAMDIVFELHEKRRRSVSDEPSVFATPQTRAFHNELAASFAAKGWLNLNFLTADGEAIAAGYCFDYRGKTYAYQGGSDPRFDRYAVNTLLRLRVIEGSIQRGLREYDFMKGAERYKFDWPVHIRRSLAIDFVRRDFIAKTLWTVEKRRRQLGQVVLRDQEPPPPIYSSS